MQNLPQLLNILLLPLRKIWQVQYWFQRVQLNESLPEMFPQPLEGYTDKPFYFSSETVNFYLKSDSLFTLTVEKITAPYTYEKIEEFSFEKIDQVATKDSSINGCKWGKSFSLSAKNYSSGYYRATLKANNKPDFYITFIIQSEEKSPEVVIVAPVSTWLAYNPYGGKSAYKNIVDSQNVHKVSNQRPNTALQYKPEGHNIHDINVEANIFNWFSKNYKTAIVPDTHLENSSLGFEEAKIWVLAYHCEYISFKMYKSIRNLVYNKHKSLISLGANQIYWKVKYHDNMQKMEVRKDSTLFSNTLTMGGMWRHTLYPEAKLLGVAFTDPGTGTYAPYQILDPDHWLFSGLTVKKGETFGKKGINDLGICGDETDKFDPIFSGSETEVLAKGLNCEETGEQIEFNDPKYVWNGKGGGEIALKKFNKGNACLATGSIQSGSGLGTDHIFTTIIKNFTDRYLKTKQI